MARTLCSGLRALLPASTLALFACASASVDVEPVASALGTGESVWEHLASKYDLDGDDAISRDEYDRGEQRFANLDRDEDGAITRADVEQRGMLDTPAMRRSLAQRVLQKYFGQDEDPDVLLRTELELSVYDADADIDDALDAEEFSLFVESQGAEPLSDLYSPIAGDQGRFGLVRIVVDTDEDEQLSLDELLAFFDELDSDGSGSWVDPGSSFSRAMDDAEPMESGVPEGEPAPDFELPRLGDGQLVRLSSFRGDRPVALIFGSYT